MNIYNGRDLRNAYRLLRFATTVESDNPDNISEMVAGIKRDIRQFLRDHDHADRRIVKDYGIDGYVMLIECPGWVENENDAQMWFEDYEYVPVRYEAWDCTGYALTLWHKLFRRRGKWYCYHRIGFDV